MRATIATVAILLALSISCECRPRNRKRRSKQQKQPAGVDYDNAACTNGDVGLWLEQLRSSDTGQDLFLNASSVVPNFFGCLETGRCAFGCPIGSYLLNGGTTQDLDCKKRKGHSGNWNFFKDFSVCYYVPCPELPGFSQLPDSTFANKRCRYNSNETLVVNQSNVGLMTDLVEVQGNLEIGGGLDTSQLSPFRKLETVSGDLTFSGLADCTVVGPQFENLYAVGSNFHVTLNNAPSVVLAPVEGRQSLNLGSFLFTSNTNTNIDRSVCALSTVNVTENIVTGSVLIQNNDFQVDPDLCALGIIGFGSVESGLVTIEENTFGHQGFIDAFNIWNSDDLCSDSTIRQPKVKVQAFVFTNNTLRTDVIRFLYYSNEPSVPEVAEIEINGGDVIIAQNLFAAANQSLVFLSAALVQATAGNILMAENRFECYELFFNFAASSVFNKIEVVDNQFAANGTGSINVSKETITKEMTFSSNEFHSAGAPSAWSINLLEDITGGFPVTVLVQNNTGDDGSSTKYSILSNATDAQVSGVTVEGNYGGGAEQIISVLDKSSRILALFTQVVDNSAGGEQTITISTDSRDIQMTSAQIAGNEAVVEQVIAVFSQCEQVVVVEIDIRQNVVSQFYPMDILTNSTAAAQSAQIFFLNDVVGANVERVLINGNEQVVRMAEVSVNAHDVNVTGTGTSNYALFQLQSSLEIRGLDNCTHLNISLVNINGNGGVWLLVDGDNVPVQSINRSAYPTTTNFEMNVEVTICDSCTGVVGQLLLDNNHAVPGFLDDTAGGEGIGIQRDVETYAGEGIGILLAPLPQQGALEYWCKSSFVTFTVVFSGLQGAELEVDEIVSIRGNDVLGSLPLVQFGVESQIAITGQLNGISFAFQDNFACEIVWQGAFIDIDMHVQGDWSFSNNTALEFMAQNVLVESLIVVEDDFTFDGSGSIAGCIITMFEISQVFVGDELYFAGWNNGAVTIFNGGHLAMGGQLGNEAAEQSYFAIMDNNKMMYSGFNNATVQLRDAYINIYANNFTVFNLFNDADVTVDFSDEYLRENQGDADGDYPALVFKDSSHVFIQGFNDLEMVLGGCISFKRIHNLYVEGFRQPFGGQEIHLRDDMEFYKWASEEVVNGYGGRNIQDYSNVSSYRGISVVIPGNQSGEFSLKIEELSGFFTWTDPLETNATVSAYDEFYDVFGQAGMQQPDARDPRKLLPSPIFIERGIKFSGNALLYTDAFIPAVHYGCVSGAKVEFSFNQISAPENSFLPNVSSIFDGPSLKRVLSYWPVFPMLYFADKLNFNENQMLDISPLPDNTSAIGPFPFLRGVFSSIWVTQTGQQFSDVMPNGLFDTDIVNCSAEAVSVELDYTYSYGGGHTATYNYVDDIVKDNDYPTCSNLLRLQLDQGSKELRDFFLRNTSAGFVHETCQSDSSGLPAPRPDRR